MTHGTAVLDKMQLSRCTLEMRNCVAALAIAAIIASTPAVGGTDRQTRQIFEAYSECAAKLHPKDAAEVVLSNENTEELIKRHQALLAPDCLDAEELRMPAADYVRYGLAEALVRREFANGLPSDIGQAGPLQHYEPNDSDFLPKPGKAASVKELTRLEQNKKDAVAVRLMSIFGECVVRADPQAALALLLSRSDSSRESGLFAAMNGTLASCLPKGQTITLDKTALRGTLAMNLYRLAHAPRLQVAAQPK